MATLYVIQGPDKGRALPISEARSVVGRHSGHVPLNDNTVSRRHAVVQMKDGRWHISDLGSSNGTYLNGERLSAACRLKDGDQIKIGGTLLLFRGNGEVDGDSPSRSAREMIDVNGMEGAVDTSILSAIESDRHTMLAGPETAEAVHASKLMYQLAEAIGGIGSISTFLGHVANIIREHITVDRLFILMRKDSTGELEPVMVRYRKGRKGRRERISTSRTLINRVIDTRSGVLCTNATSDSQFSEAAKAASLQSFALRSVICVPIMGHDQVLGVIHLDCPASLHTYSHEQLRLAMAVGRVIGLAIENHRLIEARMKHERLAATGETVAYLSHHIRNILQGLRSGADVVDLGLERENMGTVKTGWRIVENNLGRIYHLATNMLTFSKDRKPRIEMVQINNLVEDAMALAQRQASDKGVALRQDLDDIPAAPVDPDGVHQAVFNLILNAVAACPPESGVVEARTHFDPVADAVSIIVSDNGPGIPPDRIDQVFLPFHSSKGQGGTGLGLAAAKKIANELDGEIRVRSTVGVGTSFEIRLPATRPSVADSEKTHGPAR